MLKYSAVSLKDWGPIICHCATSIAIVFKPPRTSARQHGHQLLLQSPVFIVLSHQLWWGYRVPVLGKMRENNVSRKGLALAVWAGIENQGCGRVRKVHSFVVCVSRAIDLTTAITWPRLTMIFFFFLNIGGTNQYNSLQTNYMYYNTFLLWC